MKTSSKAKPPTHGKMISEKQKMADAADAVPGISQVSEGKTPANAAPASPQGKIRIPEGQKQALFALLAILAIGAALYVSFFQPSETPSTLQAFASALSSSDSASIFMDARGADASTSQRLYQCGVDIISGLGSKRLLIYGCDGNACISMRSDSNGSSPLTGEQFDAMLRQSSPSILIRKGAPSVRFLLGRMEIYDEKFSSPCGLRLTEEAESPLLPKANPTVRNSS